MLFIEVADPGKEAPDFRREVPRKRGRLNKGFLDVECVVVFERQGEIAVERLIDIGLKIDLALADTKTAGRRARLIPAWSVLDYVRLLEREEAAGAAER